VGLLECIAVGWYAKGRPLNRLFKEQHPLRKYVNSVSDFKIGWWWDLCIMVLTPAALTWLLFLAFKKDITEPYEDYPAWARMIFGWGVAGGAILIGVFFMALRGGGEAPDEEEML
jgi:NSS family neurotransmitter:Na+ symporter